MDAFPSAPHGLLVPRIGPGLTASPILAKTISMMNLKKKPKLPLPCLGCMLVRLLRLLGTDALARLGGCTLGFAGKLVCAGCDSFSITGRDAR